MHTEHKWHTYIMVHNSWLVWLWFVIVLCLDNRSCSNQESETYTNVLVPNINHHKPLSRDLNGNWKTMKIFNMPRHWDDKHCGEHQVSPQSPTLHLQLAPWLPGNTWKAVATSLTKTPFTTAKTNSADATYVMSQVCDMCVLIKCVRVACILRMYVNCVCVVKCVCATCVCMRATLAMYVTNVCCICAAWRQYAVIMFTRGGLILYHLCVVSPGGVSHACVALWRTWVVPCDAKWCNLTWCDWMRDNIEI